MRARFLSAALSALTLLLSGGHVWAGGPALVFDPSDGKVLYAEDADDQWHPASLTKIMTAYLTFEALKAGKLTLEQRIPYSELCQQQPPSKLGLHIGANLTVDQALKALIIKSANDVAVMLAEAISGSQGEFVARMNQTAKALGMTRTQFVNPNGLPAPEQVTTARDLGKLARAVVKDYPEYSSYWSMFDARLGKIYIGTHNGLLRTFDGADGMKTGFICDSGFNVVASATRDGRRVMAVVLGEATGGQRTVRAANLLEHGFQSYGWKAMFNDSQSIDTMPIAADAKTVMSVRKDVKSFECGTGVRKGPARKKGVRKKQRSVDGTGQPVPDKPQSAVTKIAGEPPNPTGKPKIVIQVPQQ
ncbi:MAG TPA: D-alanyl-D-alanine carboxypeptidase family protein [Hyphomicrobium sp.]|nr:D-alanyl-D-alanine carboxypeptidase family protein [Hyphomicrobium sp.]